MTKSIELRLPDSLANAIDQRVAKVNATRDPDDGLSRNTWLIKALQWAIEQPITKRTTEERI